MKKTLLLLLSLSLLTPAFFAKTVTDINLSNAPYADGAIENKYGDKIMYQDVTINTKDFKINNYWGHYSDTADNQSNFSNIATSAKVKLTIENSFTCKDGGLLADGCSGQKPFLVNNGILNNPDLKLDSTGAQLPQGEYRIPFDSASDYNTSHDDAFYALDVFRDGQYYEPITGGTTSTNKPKNFFGYILAFFKDYFSKDTTVYGSGIGSPEQRDRYMANITFGLQKKYRIAKEGDINTTQTNAADANKKVSLLDYNSLIDENTTGCNGLFFSYDSDSLTCKAINFFGLSQWMPFINSTNTDPEKKIKSDSVLEDTETTLLTLAGKLDKVNYIDKMKSVDTATGKTFLQEMFKPMSYMMKSMFRFFFGANSKNLTEVVSVDFNFTNPMPLTFIETNGTNAVDFIYFKLLGLESVYGTEVQSCQVHQKGNVFKWFGTDKTFTEGNTTNTQFDMDAGWSAWASDSSTYNELNTTIEQKCVGIWPMQICKNHDIVNLSTNDWLNWCKRNQGKQKKGLFGRIFDTFTNITSFVLYGSPSVKKYDDQVDKVLSDNNWEVKTYTEKVHKGLILHLKKIDMSDINASTPGTTTKFQIMKISRGQQK